MSAMALLPRPSEWQAENQYVSTKNLLLALPGTVITHSVQKSVLV